MAHQDHLTDTQRLLKAMIDSPAGLVGVLTDCATVCRAKRSDGGPSEWFNAARVLDSAAARPSIEKVSQ